MSQEWFYRIGSGPPQACSPNFATVLARAIKSIEDDPAQLRNVVYELARIKLQRECLLKYPPLTILETRRLLSAYEVAIERIETASFSPRSVDKTDFATVLTQTIGAIGVDPAQFTKCGV